MKRKIYLLFILFTLALNGRPLFSAVFESYGLGARAIGMSSSLVAVGDDYTSSFFNPAGIARLQDKTFYSEYRNLYGLGLLRYTAVGYLQPGVGKGTVGFTWYRLDTVGEAASIDYAENTLSFSYGISLFSPLYLGVNGKYYRVHSTLGASGMGLDFGILYVVDERWLKVGAAVQDLNRTLLSWDSGVKERIPLRLRVGFSSKPLAHTLVSTQVDWKDQSDQTHRFGLEQEFFEKVIALRVGALERASAINFSWGLALRWKGWSFDYGWERERLLGDTQVFSLSVRY